MAKEPREFEIYKLLEITRNDKYATAVAAFEVIDQAERLEIPRKWKNRKPAVQAMMALSEEMVHYGFITDEARQQLREELREEDSEEAMQILTSAAPVTDDSEEDLDEIGETEPVDVLSEGSEESEDSDDSDDDDDDDSDNDEDDDTDSDDEEEEDD
ncbi:MAG: DNA primase [Leptospiraceae bacterium]|nr:DNA primase [Leptospiraceae bacterium]